MKEFDRVRIKKSEFVNDKYNPLDMGGTVVSVNGKYSPIIVLWDNGIRNSYIPKNLELL